MSPQRIQRRRTKGWTMPENTIYVGRRGKYGNPFRVGHHYKRDAHGGIPRMGLRFIYLEAFEGYQDASFTTIRTAAQAVDWYRWYMSTKSAVELQEIRAALNGKDLACWCRLDQPCHADVLLEIANQ